MIHSIHHPVCNGPLLNQREDDHIDPELQLKRGVLLLAPFVVIRWPPSSPGVVVSFIAQDSQQSPVYDDSIEMIDKVRVSEILIPLPFVVQM